MNVIFILLTTVTPSFGWQYFTSLSAYNLIGSIPEIKDVHSEYFYGDCKRPTMIFYTHVYLDHLDVLGKKIIRGWIDIIRIPTCIVLRAKAFEPFLLRNTLYEFQICVPRISYCHSQTRFKYFYYEWYIPYRMVGGMDWDLFFYGPPSTTWQ